MPHPASALAAQTLDSGAILGRILSPLRLAIGNPGDRAHLGGVAVLAIQVATFE